MNYNENECWKIYYEIYNTMQKEIDVLETNEKMSWDHLINGKCNCENDNKIWASIYFDSKILISGWKNIMKENYNLLKKYKSLEDVTIDKVISNLRLKTYVFFSLRNSYNQRLELKISHLSDSVNMN